MTKPKGRLESEVLSGVLSYLDIRQDIFYWRQNTGAAKFEEFYVKFGLEGQADIQGLLAPFGRFFGIELKREIGGVVSDAQKRWGQNVINHGGIWVVARSVIEVERALGPEKSKIMKIRKDRVIHR